MKVEAHSKLWNFFLPTGRDIQERNTLSTFLVQYFINHGFLEKIIVTLTRQIMREVIFYKDIFIKGLSQILMVS